MHQVQLTLLLLVFDTAALRFGRSATVLKASRSNAKQPAIQGSFAGDL
jgi:hypothetical protein